MASCSQSMQQTRWSVANTTIVTGSYWGLELSWTKLAVSLVQVLYTNCIPTWSSLCLQMSKHVMVSARPSAASMLANMFVLGFFFF